MNFASGVSPSPFSYAMSNTCSRVYPFMQHGALAYQSFSLQNGVDELMVGLPSILLQLMSLNVADGEIENGIDTLLEKVVLLSINRKIVKNVSYGSNIIFEPCCTPIPTSAYRG